MSANIMTLCNVMSCILVDKYPHFGKTYSILLQGRGVKLEGTGSSQTLALMYEITRHISEDRNHKRRKRYTAQHFDMVKFWVQEFF
jgi:hypothetical protein